MRANLPIGNTSSTPPKGDWFGRLNELFVHTLQDIYYAEQQIAKNLPDMIEKATDQTLKNGFETHLSETRDQITRLEKVFQMYGVEAKGVDCRRSMASCRKRATSPATSTTSKSSTPRSSRQPRPSSTTRSRATAR